MADLIAHTLSNTFRVKDEVAFLAWCEQRELRVHKSHQSAIPNDVPEAEDPVPVFSIHASDYCTWPTFDHDDDKEVEFKKELAAFLHPQDVAILFEIAYEGDRYVGGAASALHPDGRSIYVALHSIYALAKVEFGPNLNIAEALY